MNIQTNLFDFAFVPAWLEQLDELAGMTLPESWSFVSPSKTGINAHTPILERYINTVFHKQALAYIFAQDDASADREFYIRNEFSCFHTGLFTKRYEGIYMHGLVLQRRNMGTMCTLLQQRRLMDTSLIAIIGINHLPSGRWFFHITQGRKSV